MTELDEEELALLAAETAAAVETVAAKQPRVAKTKAAAAETARETGVSRFASALPPDHQYHLPPQMSHPYGRFGEAPAQSIPAELRELA